nr:MAG: peptidase M16 [Thermoproteus sp. AZ2]
MRGSFKSEVLDNGVLLLVDTYPSSLASIAIGIRVGPLYEREEERGYSHLLEHAMFNVPGFDVDRAVESLGGETNAYTHRDLVVLTFQALAESFEGLAEAALRVLTNRSYEEDRFEREKRVVLSEIRTKREDPGERIGDLGLRALFGEGAWGAPIEGYPEVVGAASVRDIVEFEERWIRPNRLIVAATGGVGRSGVERLRAMLSALEGEAPEGDPPPMAKGPGHVEELDESISGIYYSYAVKVTTRQPYLKLNAAAFHLASGTKSLLFRELRERGLAYSYYVDFDSMGDEGFLQVVVESANDLEGVRRVVKRLLHSPEDVPEYRLRYFEYDWNKNMENPLSRAYAYVEAVNKGIDPANLEQLVRGAVAEGVEPLAFSVEYAAEAVLRPRP